MLFRTIISLFQKKRIGIWRKSVSLGSRVGPRMRVLMKDAQPPEVLTGSVTSVPSLDVFVLYV